MSKMIDKLINVSISISKSALVGDSFSKLLLVVAKPSDGNPPASFAEYSSVAELVTAGFAEDSDICNAANVAFSNGASSLYVATLDTGESITTVLDKASTAGSWYGLALVGLEAKDLTAAAGWAESNDKLLGFTEVGTIKNNLGKTYLNSHGWYVKDSTETGNTYNKYLHIAVMAKCFTYEAGKETWAYKRLSLISPSELTDTERQSIESENLNYYVECAGASITVNGKTTDGEWIDVVRGKAWLQSDMQNRVYNLFVKNPKVPFTSAGIALIQNQMIASLKQGQTNGLISADEYDEDGNTVPGYTVTVPAISAVSDADRAARNLGACTFTARLAGAIHLVEIKGTLVQ